MGRSESATWIIKLLFNILLLLHSCVMLIMGRVNISWCWLIGWVIIQVRWSIWILIFFILIMWRRRSLTAITLSALGHIVLVGCFIEVRNMLLILLVLRIGLIRKLYRVGECAHFWFALIYLYFNVLSSYLFF